MVPELDQHKVQIQRIVSSKAFKTSEVHRNLFNYLADKSLAGEAHNLKEYTVGLDVFGKPASYDPREESVVRMHVARLRQKLSEYYQADGANDRILIELPKGGFRVTFDQRPTESENSVAQLEADPRQGSQKYLRELALVACLVIAILATWYLAARLARVQQGKSDTSAALSAELQQLWSSILDSSRPLVVCIATPSSGSSSAGMASGAFLLGQFLASRKEHLLLTRGDLLS